MQVFYTDKPEAVMYMPLPNGMADVWLREDISEMSSDDNGGLWVAEEVYFRTTLTQEQVEEDFDTLFENNGMEPAEAVGDSEEITISERLDAIEAAISELAEVIVNG